MKINRRKLFASIGSIPLTILGVGGYMRYIEPDWFEITNKTVKITGLVNPIKVLHLSDFHSSDCVGFSTIEKSIDLSLAEKPDIAFLTGDYITHHLIDQNEYKRILTKLSRKTPTYACVGNHDGGLWASRHGGYQDFSKIEQMLSDCGIHFLFNQKESIIIKQNELEIVGLGDYWSGDTKPEEVLKHQDEVDQKDETNNPIIVMSHNPDSKEMLKPYHWDLLLCGHTHGGQLVVPFLGYRPFLPVKDHSFPEGLLHWDNKSIHITRGVGNLHGLRFNCPPELSLLNLV